MLGRLAPSYLWAVAAAAASGWVAVAVLSNNGFTWVALAAAVAVASMLRRVARSHSDAWQTALERRFGVLGKNSSDMVTLVDADGVIVYQSPSIERMLGLEASAVERWSFRALLHADDHAQLDGILASGKGKVIARWRMLDSHGVYRTVESVVTNEFDDPDVGGLLVNTRDLTERLELEKELRHQALHDCLTELPNRDMFVARAGSVSGSGRHAVILYLDLNGFKPINDEFGHAIGDAVLRQVAVRLRAAVRNEDVVARLGGDEFAVLSIGARVDDGRRLARRIDDLLREPLQASGEELVIAASIGVAELHPGEHVDDALRRADRAMYLAKRGRTTIEAHAPELETAGGARSRGLTGDLRRGLPAGQVVAYFQPQVELVSGRVRSFEALVRWHHPDLGLVGPDQILTAAAGSGQLPALTRCVIEQALVAAAGWPGDVGVSVNLTGADLRSHELIDWLPRAFERFGVAPTRLCLEVTEDSLELADGLSERFATALADLGVGLSLDDFGTGHSSLTRLRALHVEELKLDRSFVSSIEGSPRDRSIVRGAVLLAHELKLRVVAEGVEQPETAESLRALGCDVAQGWLYGRPMPVAEATALLKRGAATAA